MKKHAQAKPVERLFPFVLRSRNLLVGHETLRRNKGRLHFVLITCDISAGSRAETLRDFAHDPVEMFPSSKRNSDRWIWWRAAVTWSSALTRPSEGRNSQRFLKLTRYRSF